MENFDQYMFYCETNNPIVFGIVVALTVLLAIFLIILFAIGILATHGLFLIPCVIAAFCYVVYDFNNWRKKFD